MTQYLLDTDSLIFLLKRQPTVEARARQAGMQTLALSAITVAEVLYGAYASSNAARSLQETWALVRQLGHIIDVNSTVADKFGEIKADLRRQGLLIADFDLLIGATALASQRVLVTNNQRHFQRLAVYGVQLDNWVV
ncbi:MAG TPA: PIN domain-containing protein [Ktedonobacterales bacterium]|nr:PIN domain-containing protein [Ktedonobacterales bacterium]